MNTMREKQTKQRGFSTLELIFTLFFITTIALFIFGIGQCSQWLSSGEFAKDLGETIGEVQKGIEQGRKGK